MPTLMDSFRKEREDIEARTTKKSLIAGATPLLVGLLAGNTGDALDIASKGILESQKQGMEQEKSLLDFLKSKDKASAAGAGKLFKVRDPESGKLTYQRFDEAAGGIAPEPRRTLEETVDIAKQKGAISGELYKGKKTFATEEAIRKARTTGADVVKVKDPETGKEYLVKKSMETEGAPEKKDIFQDVKAKLPPRQMKKVEKAQADISAVTTKNDTAITEITSALEGIEKGGELGKKLGVMRLVKQIETRLSDADRAFYKNPLGKLRALKEAIRVEKEGNLRPELVQQARDLMYETLKQAQAYEGKAKERKAEQLAFDPRIPKDIAIEALGRVRHVPLAPTDDRITTPAIGTVEDGYKFIGPDNAGDPKQWEKVK